MKHKLAPEIIKECDIRGVTGKELTTKDAYYIGRAFGTILNRRGHTECTVGQDGRLSSDGLRKEAVQGLKDAGIDVLFIGIVPTPMVYFAANKYKTGAGMMITASHNPPEYNGFKFVTAADSFHGADIQELAATAAAGDFRATGKTPVSTLVDSSSGFHQGGERSLDTSEDYISYLHSFLNRSVESRLKIVWDPGNGASAAILPAFLKDLPGDHIVICGEVDGTFPHHHPDPSLPSNVIQLKEKVLEEKADFGVAFDGDGDRIGVVDGRGRLLYGDQLLVLFARDFLREFPGAEVMSEVKASQFFYDEIAALGGKPRMWKVGHTNQKTKMKEKEIGLAGETSGHIFFAENRGFDDALFAAVKLINFLNSSSETLAEIHDSFPRFFDSGEIRVTLNKTARLRVIEEIKARLREEKRHFIDIDGIRASVEGGFWSLRSSNTQPHLTIRCEAKSEKNLNAGLADLEKQLGFSGIQKNSFIKK